MSDLAQNPTGLHAGRLPRESDPRPARPPPLLHTPHPFTPFWHTAPTSAPFTRAIASLAHSALGQREAAQDLLYLAISDLDKGLAQIQRRGGATEAAWVEYTTLIKRAAGEVGDHRLVLNLHSRWPGRELPLGAFPAGVAAFNLGRYGQAAKLWRRIAAPDWARLMRPYGGGSRRSRGAERPSGTERVRHE